MRLSEFANYVSAYRANENLNIDILYKALSDSKNELDRESTSSMSYSIKRMLDTLRNIQSYETSLIDEIDNVIEILNKNLIDISIESVNKIK